MIHQNWGPLELPSGSSQLETSQSYGGFPSLAMASRVMFCSKPLEKLGWLPHGFWHNKPFFVFGESLRIPIYSYIYIHICIYIYSYIYIVSIVFLIVFVQPHVFFQGFSRNISDSSPVAWLWEVFWWGVLPLVFHHHSSSSSWNFDNSWNVGLLW